jgi:hypothetical protein
LSGRVDRLVIESHRVAGTQEGITMEQDTQDMEITTEQGKKGRRRKAPLIVLALLSLITAFSLIGPSKPAEAATMTSSGTVCFRQMGGGAFTGPVTSQIWTNQGWQNFRTFAGTNSGCQTYSFFDHYYWRFVVNYRLGQSHWTAQSGWIYARPYTYYRLGTYTVNWNVRYY